jgi:hypothetical protein
MCPANDVAAGLGQDAQAGAYWRELLAQAMERGDSRWTFPDLLDTVSCCEARLVDVAGWLCDEIRLGRIRVWCGEDGSVMPQCYELAPGVDAYAQRLSR